LETHSAHSSDGLRVLLTLARNIFASEDSEECQDVGGTGGPIETFSSALPTDVVSNPRTARANQLSSPDNPQRVGIFRLTLLSILDTVDTSLGLSLENRPTV
jgi:hypothetical protein